MKINHILYFFLSLIIISSATRADIPHLSKSIVIAEQPICDPQELDCFHMVSATVTKDRSALIKDAALASMAAYNQESIVAKISKPIRSQKDDNARIIMRGLGEDVITFGDEVPEGIISFNREHNRITVAFHGTESRADLKTDANYSRVSNNDLLASGTIHGGFNERYTKAIGAMFTGINQLLRKHATKSKVHYLVTGHSMGAALATLAAVDIKRTGDKLYLITFSSPRLVDYAGAEEITALLGEDYIMRVWRHKDVVAAMGMGIMGFKHVGKSIRLEAKSSVALKANHKMRTILEDAYSQENVEFITDHVGFGKGISQTTKFLFSKLNPMNWFSK
jgi:hypothetical protein